MAKPKVGISTLYLLGEPFNRMAKHLGELGTQTIEILDDGTHELNKTRIKQLREAAKSYNLQYSIHAPFADVNIGSPNKTMLNASLKRLKTSLQYAAEVDAKIWVFHPGQKTGIGQFYPDADFKTTCQSIQTLYAAAEEVGVNMALENLPAKYWFLMSTPEEYLRLYRETNLPIGITLDIGHAHLEGQIQPFFNLLADKIIHIHASDNHGSDDEHLGVGDGNIDYNWFAEALHKISYDKSVVIESTTHIPESIQKLKQLLA